MRSRVLPIMTFVLLLLTAVAAKANPVDMRQARKVGAKFISANTAMHVAADQDLQWVTSYRTTNDDAAFHVFNTPKGFVIVSADDCARPILGYSDEGHFDTSDVPVQMQEYLQGFVEQIQYGIDNHIVADETIAREWELVQATGLLSEERGTTAVQPLLTDTWNQNCYYNNLCPTDSNGPCGHVYAGCVATSCAQIMHFWGYPSTGTGSHTYTPSGYPQQTANFGATTYQWNNMPNNINASSSSTQINAVATLIWHCGVAVDMMYGADGSGAYSEDVGPALRNYFGYSDEMTGIYRSNYSDAQWLALVKGSLDAGRPVHYSGNNGGQEGHAFVCDGYDSNDYLHFNWGWSGNCNNYFSINALNPNGYNFSMGNYAIINIHPDCPTGTTYQVTASASPANGGTVTGGGTYNCGTECTLTATPAEGYMFCSWTENGVQVSTETSYSFTVTDNRNLVANFSYVDGDACTLVFNLVDSYGDGWNGNALTVSYSTGCTTSEQLTLESGSSGTFTRNVVDGSHIVLGWVTGSYTYECSFNITYADGTMIYQGSDLSSSFSYEFDVNCGAPTYYNITASASPSNGGTVSGAGSYAGGVTCTLTASANSGYSFVNWTKDGNVVSNSSSYSFTVTENAAYVANFRATTPPSPTMEVVAEYYPDANDPYSPYVKVSWSEPTPPEPINGDYYDFEGGLPEGWTIIDANGDGYTWTATSAIPTTWSYYEGIALDWYHSGSDAMCSGSYINGVGTLVPDEYLIMPQTVLEAGSQLNFWVAATDTNYPADHFGVFISTTGTNPSDFQSVQEWTLSAKSGPQAGKAPESREGKGVRTGSWYNYTVDLSAYTGSVYIAFRHFDCTDQYIMALDDVTLGTTDSKSNRSTYSLYRANCDGSDETLIAENLTGNEYIDYDWSSLDHGNYKYGLCVVNRNGNAGEIQWSTTSVAVNGTLIDASALNNATVNSGNPGVPSMVNYNEGWLYYDDGAYATNVGTGESTVYWATMFPSDMLLTYGVTSLTKVALYENSYNTEPITLEVYFGGSVAPGTLVYSETFTPEGNSDFQEVTLGQTVELEGQNVWIVFSEYGTYPAAACSNTGDANNRWISLDGASWDDLVDYGLDYSWMIRGFFEGGGGGTYAWSNCLEKTADTPYTITATAVPANGGTVTGAGTYYLNETCNLTANAQEGYLFMRWEKDGEMVSTMNTYSFTVTEEATYQAVFEAIDGVYIGDGGTTTNQYLPSYSFYNYTLSQQIYTADEIGGGGLISSLSFFNGGIEKTRNYDIYMVQTNKASFATNTDWIAVTEDDLMFSGNVTMTPGYWTTITFEEPFVYDGISNLAIIMDDNTGTWSSGMSGRVFDTDEAQAIRVYGDYTDYIPYNPESYEGTLHYEKNQILLHLVTGAETTQTTNFVNGWTWWSTFIDVAATDVLTQLKSGLGASGQVIKSQTASTMHLGSNWVGSLTMTNEDGYMVKTTSEVSVDIAGPGVAPENHPVRLNPGWTWIGYPSTGAMAVADALANHTPQPNDVIKGQSASAMYMAGSWRGSLTLTPGVGYMYKSGNSQAVTLTYATPAKEAEVEANTIEAHWNVNYHAYPTNMTVLAIVELDGEELNSESYELAAFADGECRGSVQMMYVEPLNRYMALLTIAGEEATNLHFGLYNTETGEEYLNADEVLSFEADAIIGEVDAPFVVRFRGTTGIDDLSKSLQVYPNPVAPGETFSVGSLTAEGNEVRVEIVNALGTKVSEQTSTRLPASMKAPATAGVYILKITIDGKETHCRKLVVR